MSFSLPTRLAPRASSLYGERPLLDDGQIEEILGLIPHQEQTASLPVVSSSHVVLLTQSHSQSTQITRSARVRRRRAQKNRRKRKEQSELKEAANERLVKRQKELEAHLLGRQAIEDDLRGLASIQWQGSDSTHEAQEAVATHIADCQSALPECEYNKLWALLWHNDLPELLRSALGRAMTFISRLYDLLDHIDFLEQTIRKIKEPQLQERRGYAPHQCGFFGYEFDPQHASVCVEGQGTLSEFVEPYRLQACLIAKEEQEYLMAGLRIRITRLQRARNALRQEGDAAHPCHILAFSAYHEWLKSAFWYVHSRAHHPGKIPDDAGRLDMAFTGHREGKSWAEFETNFRELAGTILPEDQKVAWATLISEGHTHPLTGVQCHSSQVPSRGFMWDIWLNDEELGFKPQEKAGYWRERVVRLSDMYDCED